MAKTKTRKRFRKESVKYTVASGGKAIPVKYLNRAKLGKDTVLFFRLLRGKKRKKPN